MKVEQILIKDFKKLKNLKSEINGNHILLIGKNAVGKSTLKQAIEIALGKQPQLTGVDKGNFDVVFDNNGKKINVAVKIKDEKPYLKITGEDLFIDNNKSAINQLFGDVDFNILDFVKWSESKAGEKKQVDFYKSLFEKEVIEILNKHEAKIAASYSERTDINKEITKLKGAINASSLSAYPDFELKKFESVDITALANELKTVNESNTKIKSFKERMKEKQQQIFKLKGELQILENEYSKGEDWLKQNILKDETELTTRLQNAEQKNKEANEAANQLKRYEELQARENEAGELTALIESSREAISLAIKKSDCGILGLEYLDEKLYYNGTPVSAENISTSEMLKLGMRIYAAKTKHGIILLPQTESIDNDGWNEILNFAKENDYQIIAEEMRRNVDSLEIEIFNNN